MRPRCGASPGRSSEAMRSSTSGVPSGGGASITRQARPGPARKSATGPAGRQVADSPSRHGSRSLRQFGADEGGVGVWELGSLASDQRPVAATVPRETEHKGRRLCDRKASLPGDAARDTEKKTGDRRGI